MSDEKKDDRGQPQTRAAGPAKPSEGGLRQMFARDPQAIRDVLPTEAEGDALLDMLFDDAPRGNTPEPGPPPRPPTPPAAPVEPSASADATPIPGLAAEDDGDDEEQATKLHDAEEMAALLDSVRHPPVGGAPARPAPPRPPPPRASAPGRPAPPPAPGARAAAGEVVAPPGWKISPAPPKAAAPAIPVADLEYSSAPPPDFDDSSDEDEARTMMKRPSEPPTPIPGEEPALVAAEPEGAEIAVAAGEDLGDDDDDGGRTFADLRSPAAYLDPPAAPRVDASGDEAGAEAAAEAAVEIDSEGIGEIAGDEGLTEVADLPPVEARPARSVAPSIPARAFASTGGTSFEDERDASIALSQNAGMRESFVERARWLREEALLMTDRAAQARTLLVVSELFAMAGEDDESAQAAQAAQQAGGTMPLVLRQHRSILARSGSWPRAVEVMDAEARVMPTPESKCHVAWFGAEASRLVLNDEAGAKKRVELAMRAMPTDPRAHVQRFAEALSGAPEAASLTRMRPIEAEGVTALGEAFAAVAAMRGAGRPGEAHEGYGALLAARGALRNGDAASAVAAFEALGSFGGPEAEPNVLAPASAWIAGLLATSNKDTRPAAAAALGVAARGVRPDLAARALAAVQIEMGQSEGSVSSEAFGEADRIAIAALAGGEAAVAAIDAEGVASMPELEALKSAARAVLLPRGPERRSRLEESNIDAAPVSLARALAQARSAEPLASTPIPALLGRAFEHLESQGRSTAALRPLALELDVDAGSAQRVASALRGWSGGAEDAEHALAAGLLSEVAQDHEAATAAYDQILGAGFNHESVLRARAGREDSATTARMLRGFAEQLAPGTRSAVLLTECGIRLAPEEEATEAAACLRSAADADPKLGVANYAGERLARVSGDQDALIDWLRARREASDDPVERAYDLTREALLVSDGESNAAGALLEEALRARPVDFGLRDLYERLASEAPSDRASWREARAQESTGAEAARLALEAALEYEHAGQLEQAAKAVKLAEAAGDQGLAPICAYRYALAGHGTAEFVDALLPKAREAEDPATRLEIYERLAELDERGRGDASSGLLFRRSILEENPSHLRTLRRVASTLMAQGREDELEPIALELAKALEGAEAHAWAALSARFRHRASWEETYEPVSIAFGQDPRTPWALRQMAAHARHRGEHLLAANCDKELVGRTDRPNERATLALRAAEAFRAANEGDEAKALFMTAISAVPHHPIARLSLADLLVDRSELAAAATHLEAAADAMATPAWKAETDYRAGVLLQDLGDVERARTALERVFAIDPQNDDVFSRLRKIYVAAGARAELAGLLERRLDSVTDPGERVEMEVMRGRALAEVGDAGAAKRALLAALEANPDHVDALSAFAELCFVDEDYEGAEQALIRLARLTSDADKQCEIYMRLGELYDQHLPNAERAELSYQEILKRNPEEIVAREKLVALLLREGQYPRAVEEQNHLVEGAASPEMKCQRTVELAEILEQMGELKKAENTLVVARKAYPKSDLALRALVKFYQRTGQGPSAAVLLDRAVADARRALSTGRFEPYLFETLWTAAELRGRADAAEVARATVLALDGQETELSGAGGRAGDAALDDLLAPEVMTPAFRELLLKTGPMLDQAVPFNFDAIRAAPLAPNLTSIGEEVRALAGAYGLAQINIMTSSVLGPVCIAATAHPPTIVLGQALASQPPSPVRSFLIHRALKVIQANAATFARTAPIDLWPLLAAYLKVMSPSFAPQGVDAGKLTEAHARLSRTVPTGLGQDVALLAADVIGAIGNRASTLNTAVNGWGSRAGLLAVADPNIALGALALASGALNGPPTDGKERVTWVGRNAEARDLIVFSVSDHYSDARARLGLG